MDLRTSSLTSRGSQTAGHTECKCEPSPKHNVLRSYEKEIALKTRPIPNVHTSYGCLFCDGYEDRGLSPSSGVLCVGPHSGIPPIALHLSRQARRLTDKVTLYTNGNPDLAAKLEELLKEDKDAISGRIQVVDRKIAKFERGTAHKSQIVVTFVDGDSVKEGFIAHQPLSQAKGPFAQQLGLALTPTGDIATTPPFGETTVPGVFAVGDCATQLKAVSQAVAMGTMAAGGLAFQLGADLAKVD